MRRKRARVCVCVCVCVSAIYLFFVNGVTSHDNKSSAIGLSSEAKESVISQTAHMERLRVYVCACECFLAREGMDIENKKEKERKYE